MLHMAPPPAALLTVTMVTRMQVSVAAVNPTFRYTLYLPADAGCDVELNVVSISFLLTTDGTTFPTEYFLTFWTSVLILIIWNQTLKLCLTLISQTQHAFAFSWFQVSGAVVKFCHHLVFSSETVTSSEMRSTQNKLRNILSKSVTNTFAIIADEYWIVVSVIHHKPTYCCSALCIYFQMFTWWGRFKNIFDIY